MRVLAVLILVACSGPVWAQDGGTVDTEALYMGSPESCAAAEAGELIEGDFQNLRFDDDAIQFSEEASCTIYQLLSDENAPELIATVLCTFGGQKFADTFLITPAADGSIEVSSTRTELFAAIAGGEAGYNKEEFTTSFTRCAVADLPR